MFIEFSFFLKNTVHKNVKLTDQSKKVHSLLIYEVTHRCYYAVAPFFVFICISDFLLPASISLSLSFSPSPLASACAACLAKSLMKETYWSAGWKYSGSEMLLKSYPLFSLKKKKKKEWFAKGTISVLFSLIEWLVLQKICKFLCYFSLQQVNYLQKNSFGVCIGCIMINGIWLYT